MVAINLAHVVNPANVGVRDLARDPHFGVKAVDPFFVSGKGVGQKFQRNNLAQPQVLRLINHAHTTAPKNSENPVAFCEHCPWREI
jgi:hypothetical protein